MSDSFMPLNNAFLNIANDGYHSLEALGSSDLKNLLKSPAHYKAAREEKRVPTAAMQLGTDIHCRSLEPDRFHDTYRAAPIVDRRTTKGKLIWEDFVNKNPGCEIRDLETFRLINEVGDAIRTHSVAGRELQGGVSEASYLWCDPEFGVLCKARPDYYRNGVILDIKTTQDASFNSFQRNVHSYQMHLQAAHYLKGASLVQETTHDIFRIIAVEVKKPYAIAVYELDLATLEKGEELRREALKRYSEASFKGEWGGYPNAIQPMNLPPWGFTEEF